MTLLTHVAVLSSFSTTLSPRSGGSQIFLRLFDCFDLLTHQRQARRDTWQLITAFNMILQFNYPTQYQLSIRPKIKNQWSSKHKTGRVNTIDHETAKMLTFPSKVIQSSVICTDWSCVVMSRHVSCSCGTNDLNPLAQVSDPVVSCDQRSQCISRMKYFHLNLASDHQPEQPFNNLRSFVCLITVLKSPEENNLLHQLFLMIAVDQVLIVNTTISSWLSSSSLMSNWTNFKRTRTRVVELRKYVVLGIILWY